MRKFLLLLSLTLLLPLTRAAEQHGAGPEQTIQAFYRWYVHALLANEDPFTKRRAEMKRFATDRLLREIDRMRKGPDGLDGDYFVDAQDFDKEWEKNISVAKVVQQGSRASADVQLQGREMGKRTLRVALVQEAGAWKVDRVVGHQ